MSHDYHGAKEFLAKSRQIKIKISKSQMSIDRFGYFFFWFVNLEKKLSKISSLSNLIVCHCPFPNIRIFERFETFENDLLFLFGCRSDLIDNQNVNTVYI